MSRVVEKNTPSVPVGEDTFEERVKTFISTGDGDIEAIKTRAVELGMVEPEQTTVFQLLDSIEAGDNAQINQIFSDVKFIITFHSSLMGDPIPGIDITINQKPGG